MTPSGSEPSVSSRWLANLGLLAALVLGIGLLAGFIGAVGGDASLTGTSATIVHIPDEPGEEPKIVRQGQESEPALLLLFPLLAGWVSVIYVLPVVLLALSVAEVVVRLGVPGRWLRIGGFCLAAVPALSLMSADADGLMGLFVTGMFLFIALVKLPPDRERLKAAGARPPAG